MSASTSVIFDLIARDRASREFDRVGNSASRAGGSMGKFGKLAGGALVAGVGAGALALGAFTVKAVNLEAEFSKTMNMMGAVADVPAPALKRLSDLAMKMGADTVFSANDAASAMLELAKNGIKPATIEAGALKEALTLAAAGGVDMERAASVMGNSLNAFNLKGKDAGQVAAALAGGANASSASIDSMAMALAQAATVAADAGFSIQETTGAIAAFSNAGIQGSDAGTSFKTFVSRLVPQTKKAATEMELLGISFTTADGRIKGLSDIAGILQRKLGNLSQEERATALNTMFGSDARRAATVLMNEGNKGLSKYIKATSDAGAADRTAAATMKGTAGALEMLKGSLETATLKFGLLIAPAVQFGLREAAKYVNFLSNGMDGALNPALAEAGPMFQKIGQFIKAEVVPALIQVGGFIKGELIPAISTLVTQWLAAVKKGFHNFVQAAGDIGPTIQLVKSAFSAWWAVMSSVVLPGLGKIYGVVFPAVGKGLGGLVRGVNFLAKSFTGLWNGAIQPVMKFILNALSKVMDFWGDMLSALSHVPGFGWAKDAADKMHNAANKAIDIANSIQKIPTRKDITIAYHVTGQPGRAGNSTSATAAEAQASNGGGGGGGGGRKSMGGPSSRSLSGTSGGVSVDTLAAAIRSALDGMALQVNGLNPGQEAYLITGRF